MAPEQLKGERADQPHGRLCPRCAVVRVRLWDTSLSRGRHPTPSSPASSIASRRRSVTAPRSPRYPGRRHHTMPSQATCRSVQVSDRDWTRAEPRRSIPHSRPADPVVANASVGGHRVVFLACALAWQIKEWEPGVATALFFAICAWPRPLAVASGVISVVHGAGERHGIGDGTAASLEGHAWTSTSPSRWHW